MKISIFYFISFILIIYSCSNEIEYINLRYENDSLLVVALIDTNSCNMKYVDSVKYFYGELTIQNKISHSIKYSNKNVEIVINDTLSSRTYKNTIISEVVDYGFIELQKNEILIMETYWVAKEKIPIKSVKMVYY